jgi:thiamine biosynthesis protein ThiI
MHPVIVIHHHEITLKGENRRFFEQHLMRNVRIALTGLVAPQAVRGGYGRFVVDLESSDHLDTIMQKLSRVFGVANLCSGMKVPQEVGAFCETAGHLLEGRTFSTIRVEARRPDKSFPLRSMDINAQVGEYLCKRFGVRANLSKPDETIYIEIVDGVAYVYRSKMKGAGGLPSGVSGRVVSLISAGFDSPVASWQLMRRGATVVFLHFHSMPYTSVRSVEQVRALVRVLTEYQFQSKLYLVPFAEVQNQIVLGTLPALRVVLYRRMMMRIAEGVARREKAEALVTGEALGQVASQTLRNIRVINAVSSLPILRPLSGTDKEDIMEIARRIGTHDLSKEPYDDCCSFLAPRRPATWAGFEQVAEAEAKLDIDGLVKMGMDSLSHELVTTHQHDSEIILPASHA